MVIVYKISIILFSSIDISGIFQNINILSNLIWDGYGLGAEIVNEIGHGCFIIVHNNDWQNNKSMSPCFTYYFAAKMLEWDLSLFNCTPMTKRC